MEILDYNIIKSHNLDKTKSYFSCYYKSIILFTDYNAKSYNIATRYNDKTKSNELYAILYKDGVTNNGIPIVRDTNTGYKLFISNKVIRVLDIRLGGIFMTAKNDFNVNAEFIEERDDFCVIYRIDID